jgi:hypothetical protein
MKHVKRHLNLGASNLLHYKLERGLRNFEMCPTLGELETMDINSSKICI